MAGMATAWCYQSQQTKGLVLLEAINGFVGKNTSHSFQIKQQHHHRHAKKGM
jgi:hypothetical protein